MLAAPHPSPNHRDRHLKPPSPPAPGRPPLVNSSAASPPAAGAPPNLPAFGKYRIIERVAVGGMAEIYKARLDGIGGFHRTFAIKRILPHLSARPEFVDMLVEEARIAGLLSHANIVQIVDFGQVGGTYYIAMEYVDGPDLSRILRRCREKSITLPVPHAVFIAIEMLKGMEYAHNRQVLRGGRLDPLNVVHRDISPANVLVSFQGEVKLTDFGIAKASVKALETLSGVIKGRFNYISPEQASGKTVDQRSDLFNTAVVLYEMLTGQHPFSRRNEPETVEAIREGAYTPPSHVNPDVPYPLEAFLEVALQVRPEDRYPTATAMKDALDRFFHDSGFIFSHSTLAAFLKGLFPSEARGERPAAPPPGLMTQDPVTRPVEEEVDDGPTSTLPVPPPAAPAELLVADTTIRKRPEGGFNIPDITRTPILSGLLAGVGEESTFIRPNPTLEAEGGWSNAETAIKPDPTRARTAPATERAAHPRSAERAASARRAEPSAPDRATSERGHAAAPEAAARAPADASTASRPAAPRAARPPVRPGAPPPPRRTQTGGPADALSAERAAAAEQLGADRASNRSATIINSRTFRRFQILYLVFGAVITVLVMMVGFLLGRAIPPLDGSGGEVAAVTTPAAPMLELRHPVGSRLTVDGAEVAGSSPHRLSVTPGRHKVRLEGPDHAMMETEVTVAQNDVRVVSFEVTPLPRKGQSP
jgi:serine/threonine protein kinase